MIIIKGDCIYVQKKEIEFMRSKDIRMPKSVFNSVYQEEYENINDFNQDEFVSFEKSFDILFFLLKDWLIDYSDLSEMEEDKIILFAQEFFEERHFLLERLEKIPEKKKTLRKKLQLRVELIEHAIKSIKEVLDFKNGKKYIRLPYGIRYPQYKTDSQVLNRNIQRKNINS